MKNNNKLAIDLFEKGIEMIEKKSDESFLVKYFLGISKIRDLSDDIYSFAIDAMLVAEKDFHGEFKNIEELKEGFKKLKKATQNRF